MAGKDMKSSKSMPGVTAVWLLKLKVLQTFGVLWG